MITIKLRLNDELKRALVEYPKVLPDLFGDRILHTLKKNSPFDPKKKHKHLRDQWGYEKHGRIHLSLNFDNASAQHQYLLHGNGPIYPKKPNKWLWFRWRRFGYRLFRLPSVKGINPSRPLYEIGKTYDDLIVDSVNEGIELAHQDLQDFLDNNGSFERLEENKVIPDYIRLRGTRRLYVEKKTGKIKTRSQIQPEKLKEYRKKYLKKQKEKKEKF